MEETIEISKTFNFEASHVLPKHPGKCSRLHGHSWVLKVTIEGAVDPETGFVMDYGDLKEVVQKKIIELVDHQHLGYGWVRTVDKDNQRTMVASRLLGEDFYPSSENLVIRFAEILLESLERPTVFLKAVELNETCTSAARWTRKD